MSIKSFFFPKNFDKNMKKGQRRSMYVMQLGMDRVARRGKRWLVFFMYLPIVGNFVFYYEGKKELRERSSRNDNTG